MAYNLQQDVNLRDDLDDPDLNLGPNRSDEDLEKFLYRGHFYSANPKNLMRKRNRYDWYKIIIKSLALLFSPRTILVQLESFLFIYLVTKLDFDNEHTKNFGTSVDIRVITLMVSFCIIFAINQSFARRERTLQDIATLKSSLMLVYYSMSIVYDTDKDKKTTVFMTCKSLLKYLTQYLYDRNELIENKLYSEKQNSAVRSFYSDIHKLLQLTFTTGGKYKRRTSVFNNRDSMYSDQISHSTTSASCEAMLISKIYCVLEAFERLCATKDYLTPLGIRAFTSFMLWFLPIVLAPYFVWHTEDEVTVASYAWAWLFFLMLGALVDVKAILDDIFDGDSLQDDIILDIDNILHNMKYGASPFVQDLYHENNK